MGHDLGLHSAVEQVVTGGELSTIVEVRQGQQKAL